MRMNPEEYCREIEAYLCRKNDGHLIRIVGPSFERVSSWATEGIPLKVAFGGIDRYFTRYYARGPRRRPVRIDFCEADVLDVFDEWRRATGVRGTAAVSSGPPREPAGALEESARRRPTLPVHLDRVIARLTLLRGGWRNSATLEAVLDRAVRELDAVRAKAKQIRGQQRVDLLEHLVELDREVLRALRDAQSTETLSALQREAEEELEPFRPRMAEAVFRTALEACVDRLIRERAGLPQIALE